MFRTLTLIYFFSFISVLALTQSERLVFTQPDYNNKLSIDLEINKSNHNALIQNEGVDIQFKNPSFKFNGDPIPVDLIETKGKSTLAYRRKSYSVELSESINIQFDNRVITLKDFYLISMSMDQYYFRNVLAYRATERIGIPHVSFRYVELRINGNSEGIYLLTQKPRDLALKEIQSPYVIRRDNSYVYRKEKVGDDNTRLMKLCRATFKNIPKACKKLSGERLYKALGDAIDLKQYMKWLAFNYLVNNGDYTDEVYYFAQPGTQSVHFGIIPWDYDDIFTLSPHEGMEKRNKAIGDVLIFSSEDLLDRTIATDPVLYRKYIDIFKDVLSDLDNELWQSIFEQIYTDLHTFLSDQAIIEASKTDLNPPESLVKFQKYLQTYYINVTVRRSKILKVLKEL